MARIRVTDRRAPRLAAIFAVALAYGGGFWLVALHWAESAQEHAEPPLLVHWLRDATLALPVTFAAAWLGLAIAERLAKRVPLSLDALTAFAVAYLGSGALALGSPVHDLLFDAREEHALPLPVHLARDGLVALAANLLIAAAVTAVLARPWRRLAAEARPAAPAPAATGWLAVRTTRRGLLKYGAAGAVTSAAVVGGLSRWVFPARAATGTMFGLVTRDGPVRMIDGTQVYMWGFGPADPSSETLYHNDGDPKPYSAPFTVPGPAIVVSEDQSFDVAVTNMLDEDHSFAIFDAATVDVLAPTSLQEPTVRLGTGAIAKNGGQQTLHVDAWTLKPGTYLYGDFLNAPVNRVLGLHGALIVRPQNDPQEIEGEPWQRERLWVLNDIDPSISAAVQSNQFPDPARIKDFFLPRYFTIGGMKVPRDKDGLPPKPPLGTLVPSAGGKSGRDSILNEETILRAGVGEPTLVRILNAGLAVHSPHWHGNHVIVLTDDGGAPFVQNMEKDVVIARPGAGKDVIFPFHRPLDATTDSWRSVNQTYPMHCHAEMSQTAAGGLYPNGMLAHIEFDVGNHCTTTSS